MMSCTYSLGSICAQVGGQIQSASGMVYRGTAWLEALAADFKFREQECNGCEVIYGSSWAVTLTELNDSNLEQLQSLEEENLPLRYDRAFYERLLRNPSLVRLAEVGDDIAGSLSAEKIHSERSRLCWVCQC